ncbi:hypothetical protein [Modestobacter lapidis]|nr:hypothetical protein [Modestobacter lapidis]
MDPLSLVVGGVLLAAGYLGGRLGARRASRTRAPQLPVATCGCGHSLSQHDPKDHTCHAEVPRDAFNWAGHRAGQTWVDCRCRQYVGPRPIDEVFAPRLLAPPD